METIEEDLTTPVTIISFDEISDWDDRMNRAGYSSEQRELIRQCHTKRDEWLNFCATAPWQVTDDNKKDGFLISQCTSDH